MTNLVSCSSSRNDLPGLRWATLGATVLLSLATTGCFRDDHDLDLYESNGQWEFEGFYFDGSDDPNAEEVFTVERSEPQQTVRGFGASSAWTAPRLSQEQADDLFSVESGIGLSLLRIQIKPDGTSDELETVDAAVERGAEVWAAPWSPPGDWKTNGETQNGGELLEEYYDDWAASLADFARFMDERKTPLLGISAQNEPDYTAEWDTCRYTPGELATFVGDYLAPALAELENPTPVIAPESANWGSLERYGDALMDDDAAFESLLAFAAHGYGEIPPVRFRDAIETGVETMSSALRVARIMHDDITVGQVSAWHYWWLLPRGDTDDSNAALMNRDMEMSKRAYVMGHYSRFVRPGYVRLQTPQVLTTGVMATAYESPDGDELVLVVASDRLLDVEQEVRIVDASVTEARVWITDEERSLRDEGTLEVEGPAWTLTVPANSMMTLVIPLD